MESVRGELFSCSLEEISLWLLRKAKVDLKVHLNWPDSRIKIALILLWLRAISDRHPPPGTFRVTDCSSSPVKDDISGGNLQSAPIQVPLHLLLQLGIRGIVGVKNYSRPRPIKIEGNDR